MLLVSTFELIYSNMIYFMFSEDCHNTRVSNGMDSVFGFMDRFVGYIFWFWPIICVLWPTEVKE